MKVKIRCFRCNDWLWNELEKVCSATNQTASMFIRAAIVEKLSRVQGYEKYFGNDKAQELLNENNLRKIENIANKKKGEC